VAAVSSAYTGKARPETRHITVKSDAMIFLFFIKNLLYV